MSNKELCELKIKEIKSLIPWACEERQENTFYKYIDKLESLIVIDDINKTIKYLKRIKMYKYNFILISMKSNIQFIVNTEYDLLLDNNIQLLFKDCRLENNGIIYLKNSINPDYGIGISI